MDYFSISPSFQFRGKGEHSTRLGFIASIVMGLLGLYLSYEFGRDIWERQFPNVNKTSSYVEMPPVIPVN